MAHARIAVAVLLLVCAGCGASTSQPSEPRPAAALADAAPASFQGTRWGTFHSKRFELTLGLPDGSVWKIDDHHSSWLKATHEPTRSTLFLKSWNEDQLVTKKGCLARARELEPALPDVDALPLIADESRALFGHRDARVAVGVTVEGDPPATGGFVVAVVGDVRRCFVLAFRTAAAGPEAQDAVADRLAVIESRLLPSVKIDPSFVPAREPPSLAPSGGVR